MKAVLPFLPRQPSLYIKTFMTYMDLCHSAAEWKSVTVISESHHRVIESTGVTSRRRAKLPQPSDRVLRSQVTLPLHSLRSRVVY